MALDLDKVGAAIKLAEEHERIFKQYTSMHDEVQKAAERMRDIIDPPGLRRMREMHEQLLAIADPPYMRRLREVFDSSQVKGLADMFAGITPVIDPELFGGGISKKLFDDWKLLEPLDAFAGLKALMPAESLSAAIAKGWAVDIEAVSAVSRAANIFKSISLPDYSKELTALAGITSETEKMLASLDVTRGFGDLLNITDVTRSLVEYETDRLNRAYAGFGTSVAHRPEWLAAAPDFVRTAPADIVFAQARFVRTVTTHEEIDEESAADEIWADVQTQTLGYIEAVLPQLNPKLMKSWEGAWNTAQRRGPDWARQAASSMRFLLIEVLEAVAPVDEVRKSNLPTRYVQSGQILRLGQIHWLCEPVKNRTYGKVVRADLDSAMTIIEAMNEAVHRDDYEEIEDAFKTMAIRAAVALCNLLKLWKARN
jgi:hypothetical protein